MTATNALTYETTIIPSPEWFPASWSVQAFRGHRPAPPPPPPAPVSVMPNTRLLVSVTTWRDQVSAIVRPGLIVDQRTCLATPRVFGLVSSQYRQSSDRALASVPSYAKRAIERESDVCPPVPRVLAAPLSYSPRSAMMPRRLLSRRTSRLARWRVGPWRRRSHRALSPAARSLRSGHPRAPTATWSGPREGVGSPPAHGVD